MKTNDLKKGDRIRLRNGWYGTIADNARGNIRMATVEGFETETGSVYSHDIVLYYGSKGDPRVIPVQLEHTPQQVKMKRIVEEAF